MGVSNSTIDFGVLSRADFFELGEGMFDKVLTLSAGVGAGHMRAAEALEHAFLEKGRNG
jgi:hypothetical protein